MSFKLSLCFQKFILQYIHSSFTDHQTIIEVFLSRLKKKINLISFLLLAFHDNYQTGICQADVYFVDIDHTWQLILPCSCLAVCNPSEFKSQRNLACCVQWKRMQIYNRTAMLVVFSGLEIKSVKKMFYYSLLLRCCLQSCGSVAFQNVFARSLLSIV